MASLALDGLANPWPLGAIYAVLASLNFRFARNPHVNEASHRLKMSDRACRSKVARPLNFIGFRILVEGQFDAPAPSAMTRLPVIMMLGEKGAPTATQLSPCISH